MKTRNIKRQLLSNQIATRKKKKAGQAELARKLDANVRITNFRVQGPLVGIYFDPDLLEFSTLIFTHSQVYNSTSACHIRALS